MQNNDPSSCEKSEGILKISCYSEIAKKTKNPVICEKIEESLMRGACYSNIAEETKDPTVCDKIESDIFKASCLDGAKK